MDFASLTSYQDGIFSSEIVPFNSTPKDFLHSMEN